MRIVCWIGKEPNQIALANKISKEHQIIGIVVETKYGYNKKRKITIEFLFRKIIERLFFQKITTTWKNLMNHYRKNNYDLLCPDFIEVDNINSQATLNFTQLKECDIVVVSGTFIIKKSMFSVNSRYGIVNLHTGLSPYIKGGPNCTNWCISTLQFHLIGNSVMWLNEGIDSGELILTECTNFQGDESFFEIHLKVMEHAHDLYLRALNLIEQSINSSVNQDEIGKGKTYYTKDWKIVHQYRLIKNLKQFKKVIRSDEYRSIQDKLVQVGKKNNIEK